MQETTDAVIGRMLPPQPAAWFMQARTAYLKADYGAALAQDKRLEQWAESAGHLAGRILSRRFIGLCHFRREELSESTRYLELALKIAQEGGLLQQSLLCANHLGATLRRQGKLYEAYELFRGALEQARQSRDCVHERARLYGNLGALLDALGQRAAADDCYARMEELCELLGNPDRLANARGLAARAAFLQGDLDTAVKKYEDERSLAAQSGNIARQIAATTHLARLRAGQGRVDEADALCSKARQQAEAQAIVGRRIDAWECHSEIMQAQNRLAAAYGCLKQAQTLLAELPDHAEKRATLLHRTAELCTKAGLHGEALYYLKQTVRQRSQLFLPLHQDRRVASMAQAKLRELWGLARELVKEARTVAREEHEHDAIKSLICQIRGRSEITDEELDAELGGARQEDLRLWPGRQRDAARNLWKKILLPQDFEQLAPESQEDLVRAEVSYSATVSDLPRFAHLLAVVVERELRNRIILPAADVFDRERFRIHLSGGGWSRVHGCLADREQRERVGLGGLLKCIEEAVGFQRARQGDFVSRLQPVLRPFLGLISQLAALARPVSLADESSQISPFSLLDLRNAVAHGEDARRFPSLDRLTVDAVKRTLVLEGDPPLLAQLARLRLEF